MKKHIILILLGAIAILALMFFLWFWLLRGPAPTATNTGQLGEGDTRTPTTGTAGNQGNTQTNIPSTPTTGGTVQNPSTPSYGTSIPPTSSNSPTAYIPYRPGGTWLDGTYRPPTTPSGGSTPSGTGSPQNFTPTPINQINSIDIDGTGYFPNTPNGSGEVGGGSGLIGLGLAGIVACTPGLFSGFAQGAGVGAVAGAAPGLPVADAGLRVQGTVSITHQASDTVRENFLNCIARTLARVAIDKITADVVDWINSGFEGKPAFVQDYRQFFKDLANEAAGEFIASSNLAFLCSPFQLQVKIAVAKSYAYRSGGSSSQNACTLDDVTNNIRGFMEGTFTDGGWPAFIEFTTVPTNNPFGAFMTIEAQLGNEISNIQAQARLDLELGNGFIGSTEEYECVTNTGEMGTCTRIVTPGVAIQHALARTLDQPYESLQLADNFDEIISALVSQLMTRTLYGGLSNLSGDDGYASNFISATDAQAQAAAEALLKNLQASVGLAQQYGTTQQGSISDIQNSQTLLQSLANCWSITASSSGLTTQQQDQALANMRTANTSIQALETRIALFNTDITKANSAIAKIQQFQTNALAATTKATIDAIARDFEIARNSGVLMTQADVTGVQQNRTTLQSEMASTNQTTNAQITQCYAFGN